MKNTLTDLLATKEILPANTTNLTSVGKPTKSAYYLNERVMERRQKNWARLGKPQSGNNRPKISINLENEEKTNGLK